MTLRVSPIHVAPASPVPPRGADVALEARDDR
jgi:hypothetical protein